MSGLVLVVEDDAKIAALVADFLGAEGFNVRRFPDARSVVDCVRSDRPDAVILDIMLPAGDGQALARLIRDVSDTPIIMLSARREEEDKLRALDGGADDYVTKPFSGKELVARVKAQVRRASGMSHTGDGSIGIDNQAQRVLWHGKALDLSQSEFAILTAMIRRPGLVFSRNNLLDVLGERSEESTDRAIDSHIKNIRKKITAVDAASKPIVSVYGAGYRFELPTTQD